MADPRTDVAASLKFKTPGAAWRALALCTTRTRPDASLSLQIAALWRSSYQLFQFFLPLFSQTGHCSCKSHPFTWFQTKNKPSHWTLNYKKFLNSCANTLVRVQVVNVASVDLPTVLVICRRRSNSQPFPHSNILAALFHHFLQHLQQFEPNKRSVWHLFFHFAICFASSAWDRQPWTHHLPYLMRTWRWFSLLFFFF